MRRRVLERAPQRGVADQQLRVGLLLERDVLGVREQHLRRARRRSRSPASPRPSAPARAACRETSWIESTAPSDETQSRGRMRSLSALRAYSIDEIGARSSSPSSSIAVQLGRHAGDLLDVGVEPVEDRRHVHVRDAAEADHGAPSSKNVTRLPSVVERRELARAEIRVVDAVLARPGWSTSSARSSS